MFAVDIVVGVEACNERSYFKFSYLTVGSKSLAVHSVRHPRKSSHLIPFLNRQQRGSNPFPVARTDGRGSTCLGIRSRPRGSLKGIVRIDDGGTTLRMRRVPKRS